MDAGMNVILHIGVPVLVAVTALPMVFGLVPRNSWYGFRTPRTLASDDVWYPANRFAGVAMVVAAAIWLALVLAWPAAPVRATLTGSGLLVVSLVASLVYLRRLP